MVNYCPSLVRTHSTVINLTEILLDGLMLAKYR